MIFVGAINELVTYDIERSDRQQYLLCVTTRDNTNKMKTLLYLFAVGNITSLI